MACGHKLQSSESTFNVQRSTLTSNVEMVSGPVPVTLMILIHLHLLNFPLKVSAAYDEYLFSPQKHGIGDRSKTFEEISYFLVSKIEGTRSQAKKVSTVPGDTASRDLYWMLTWPCADSANIPLWPTRRHGRFSRGSHEIHRDAQSRCNTHS